MKKETKKWKLFYTWEDYGLKRCDTKDLLGNDSEYNANELERVFSGKDQGAHRDALLMGVSLVLELMGKTSNPIDGVKIAANAIDTGKAIEFLNKSKGYFLAP